MDVVTSVTKEMPGREFERPTAASYGSPDRIPKGETENYGYDGLGSTRFLIQGSGTAWQLADSYAYDAYGIPLTPPGSIGTTRNHYRYTGEQWDADLKLYYLRARYYSPYDGRFITMDSFEGHENDPLSLHKYLYAHANPVNGTDPTGHEFNLTGMMTSVAGIGRMAVQVGLRAWSAYDRVQTFADGFNAIQSIFHAVEDGIDDEDIQAVLREAAEFAQERLTRRVVNGGLKIVSDAGGTAITAAKSGLGYIGKGRLKFEKFEVRAVRDLSHMDEEDLRKMLKTGNAGKTKSGQTIYLHHHQQNPNGPIVEIPQEFHSNPGNKNQHPLGNTKGVGIQGARPEFDAWKRRYWKARAAEELARKGLL